MNRATTSASNLFRRDICLGSADAESIFPEEEDSEQSKEGVLLHNLDAKPDPEAEKALTTDQREVLTRARKMDDQIFAAICNSMEIPDDETFEEGHERAMWFRRGLKALFPGHCDRWRYYPRFKVLIIIDKKFGYKEVQHAEANLQLRAYAVMGAAEHDCDHVLVAINQPRLSYEDAVTTASYTREDIIKAKEHILRIWDACHEPNAPRTADAEACRYCKARVNCDAYAAKYDWMSKPADDGKEFFVGKLLEMDDMALARGWDAISFAKMVEAPVKAEILKRKEAGRMPMFEVSDTGNTSTINDTVRAAQLLKAAGLADTEILSCATLAKGKLAEKIHARPDVSSMAGAKRKLTEILKPVLDITAKSPSLQRIKDWKPEPVAIENGSDDTLFPK